MPHNIQQLIERFGLVAHPEGGYYAECYRSQQRLWSPLVGAERAALTHIYFLLVAGQVSRFHRVRHDEIWNFYAGAPLRLLRYDGRKVHERLLGNAQHGYVDVIPGGLFQAAESTGAYSLVGCSVAPGFDFADFSFLTVADRPPATATTMPANMPTIFRRFL